MIVNNILIQCIMVNYKGPNFVNFYALIIIVLIFMIKGQFRQILIFDTI